MPLIVLENRYDPPVDPETFLKGDDGLNHCLAERNIVWLHSYLSSDGSRSVCLFEAPDAESVRESFRRSQQPFGSAWSAQLIDPHTGQT